MVNNKVGISTIENISTIHSSLIKVGEIKKTNEQLVDELQLSPDNNFSRTAMLGVIAAKEAVKNAGVTEINEYKTGLISATSVGGMDMTETHYYDYFEDESLIKYISCHDGGDVAHKIADELGLKGMVTTISTACSSAANAIMLGARLIKTGKLERVIVGGTDALAKFTCDQLPELVILTHLAKSTSLVKCTKRLFFKSLFFGSLVKVKNHLLHQQCSWVTNCQRLMFQTFGLGELKHVPAMSNELL